MYVYVENEQVVETVLALPLVWRNVSNPAGMTEQELAVVGMFPVVLVPQPAHDPITQNATQLTPTKVNGVWTQAWSVTAASPDEIAARTAKAAEEEERATLANLNSAIRVDDTVLFLRTHTPAEAEAWVTAQVTDLASAKLVLRKLALVVAFLARERLGRGN